MEFYYSTQLNGQDLWPLFRSALHVTTSRQKPLHRPAIIVRENEKMKLGSKDMHPSLHTEARVECAECGEVSSLDVTDEKRKKHTANERFYAEGYRVLIPENRDYIGVVCPDCQENLS